MKILITGGGGFIGSHAAEFYAVRGDEVVVFDNLSRANLLGKSEGGEGQNCSYLERHPNIVWIKEGILNAETLALHLKGVDLVIHAAAQTAVTASYEDAMTDFLVNAQGTLNVLEAARRQSKPPIIIFCSTNKVYGDRINQIAVMEKKTRYEFKGKLFQKGIDEQFGVDLCAHSPYGCSKLAADLYMQDYASRYGLKIGIFRQSCIYGPRQFGREDQGWLAWFAIATHFDRPITICGNGKQVRDVLYISDLIEAFDAFVRSDVRHQVFNLGGGPEHTISLLELIELLKKLTGKQSPLRYTDWRVADQKLYVSDITKAKRLLNWAPKVNVAQGVSRLVRWVQENEHLFSESHRDAVTGLSKYGSHWD